ncbi:PolA DNA polymerase I - 3'-5' exonuclease and polymerase domains [uncultured Caudovirales phage]|uniref:PolA DNA polymerase I - 3'-5' exonuclease and polymerase domains n=1 Tax=uncultured Caudovirales phage TaxID=2100421 RepID=A0A6J5M1U3_9CAUD|nr:PolA DNA polymerase I - 3'-5' exonuclease and polymerase domains [uncultured Caudovirales phage]
MQTIYFDIECNGLYADVTKVVCIGIHDSSTKDTTVYYRNDEINIALELIRLADEVVGHNIVGFDLPVLKKLFPDWAGPQGSVRDTLVISRLLWPDIKEQDFKKPNFNKALIGSHSLKAWGHRLGMDKDVYLEQNVPDFKNMVYTPELAAYCAKDVDITIALYSKQKAFIEEKNLYAGECLVLEHEFAGVIAQQERNGFCFDMRKASELYATLADVRDAGHRELVGMVPPTEVKLKTKTKQIPFNPGSRQQIAAALMNLGWKPEDYTPTGEPKVDEAVLSTLQYPIAKKLSEYLMVQKRIGMLAEGDEAWMKVVKADGRIHGSVNHNGAVTGRCTHRSPNLAQVTGVGSPWGKECRELFVAPAGKMLVGVDAQGLELRCLAHYLARWDEGAYGKELLEGDIHTANQKAAGLPTRNDAKKFIYAWLYGAGPAKIGSIVGGGSKEGRELNKRFLAKFPAIGKLKSAIDTAVDKRGYLTGLDGRHLPIRSQHSALNTLLQSCGAILMKNATVLMHRYIEHSKIKGVLQVAHIHDEVQLEVPEASAEEVATIAKRAISDSGLSFGFRIRLDGSANIGRNWAETH